MQKKAEKKLTLWLCITAMILAFGAYKSYLLQREIYKDNIALKLQAACNLLILQNFGQHASPFDISDKGNSDFGIKSSFTIYNELTDLRVWGRSRLFFSDYAPQELDCMAYLFSPKSEVTKNTIVTFNITPPMFSPMQYDSFLSSSPFSLTIGQIEEKFPITRLTKLEKPKYDFLSYYKKTLSEMLN